MKKTHPIYCLAYNELWDLTKKKVATAHNKTKNYRAIVKIGIFITFLNFVLNLKKFLFILIFGAFVLAKIDLGNLYFDGF